MRSVGDVFILAVILAVPIFFTLVFAMSAYHKRKAKGPARGSGKNMP